MRTIPIDLKIEARDDTTQRTIEISAVAGARFSLRDTQLMRKQLDDAIARDGYYSSATRTNPSIFRIGRYLLTQEPQIEVQGSRTSGEAEVVAIRDGRELFITVGSDHCDREIDPLFPDKPKQMCPHPIASTAWPYAEVKDHWDQLHICSHVEINGHSVALQDSTIDTQVHLETLLAMDEVKQLPEKHVLYCGSVTYMVDAIAKTVREKSLPPETAQGCGDQFKMRLHDPVLNRTIEHAYQPVPLGDDLHERSQITAPQKPDRR